MKSLTGHPLLLCCARMQVRAGDGALIHTVDIGHFVPCREVFGGHKMHYFYGPSVKTFIRESFIGSIAVMCWCAICIGLTPLLLWHLWYQGQSHLTTVHCTYIHYMHSYTKASFWFFRQAIDSFVQLLLLNIRSMSIIMIRCMEGDVSGSRSLMF